MPPRPRLGLFWTVLRLSRSVAECGMSCCLLFRTISVRTWKYARTTRSTSTRRRSISSTWFIAWTVRLLTGILFMVRHIVWDICRCHRSRLCFVNSNFVERWPDKWLQPIEYKLPVKLNINNDSVRSTGMTYGRHGRCHESTASAVKDIFVKTEIFRVALKWFNVTQLSVRTKTLVSRIDYC